MSHNANIVARHATKKQNRAQFLKSKINKASRTEQQQPVKPVQSCPNKNWIELVYKYTNNAPVSGASYRVYDLNNQSLACGTLDQMGFARVEGLPDGVTNVKFQFSSDPKPFEIFPGYKPKSHNMSEATTEIKDEDGRVVSIAKWVGTALAGDFAEDQTFGQIAFGTVVTLVPVVDQVGDVRDIIANYYQLTIKQRYNEFGPWFGLVTTLFGCVPEIGSVVKGMIKSVVTKVGSKLPLPQLMKFMNSVGMGNVVAFLRDFLSKIDGHADKFSEKIVKMLDTMKWRLEKAKNLAVGNFRKRVDETLEGIARVYHLVPGKVREIIEVIAGHLKKTLDEARDFVMDGVTRVRNGARQLEEKFFKRTAKTLAAVAERAGMTQDQVERLIRHCGERDRVVVIRATNPESLKFQNGMYKVGDKEYNCLPKPVTVKLNTAKDDFPPSVRGLVVKPKVIDKNTAEDIKKLEKAGFKFDDDGVLHDSHGNVFHGDYDVQSVHRYADEIDEAGNSKTVLMSEMSNPQDNVETVDQLNKAIHDGIVPDEMRSIQHGGEADFRKSTKEDEKGILTADQLNTSGANGGVMEVGTDYRLGRQYGKNEKYIIITPSGAEILESPEELKAFYKNADLPWEYDPTLPTAAIANAANNAERAVEKTAGEHQSQGDKK